MSKTFVLKLWTFQQKGQRKSDLIWRMLHVWESPQCRKFDNGQECLHGRFDSNEKQQPWSGVSAS